MSRIVMGISIEKRSDVATQVQNLLTEYGCFIRTRLGLHQVSEDFCSEDGLVILEFLKGADVSVAELKEKLNEIDKVVVKTMEF